VGAVTAVTAASASPLGFAVAAVTTVTVELIRGRSFFADEASLNFADEATESGVIASNNLAEPESIYITFLQTVPVLARYDS
jgi:hypothetical protein